MPSDIFPPVEDAGTECVDGFCPMPTHTPKPKVQANGRAKSVEDLDPFVVWKVRANDDLDLLIHAMDTAEVVSYCQCQATLLLIKTYQWNEHSQRDQLVEMKKARWWIDRVIDLREVELS